MEKARLLGDLLNLQARGSATTSNSVRSLDLDHR
jgi:hypothetical protein